MSKYNIYLSLSQCHPDVRPLAGWVCKYGITQRRELATTFTINQVRDVLEHYHSEGRELFLEIDAIDVEPRAVTRWNDTH